jgi:hypothetical protein
MRGAFIIVVVVLLAALATVLALIGGKRDPYASGANAGSAPGALAPSPTLGATAAPPLATNPAPPRTPSSAVAVVEPPALAPGPAPAPSVRAGALAPDPGTTPAALADGWGGAAAPTLDPRPFSEAHWQGLELIPKTATLVKALSLPADVSGVVVDDVSLPADLQGFRAGDLVTTVGGVPTPDLSSVIRAAERVREEHNVELDVVRRGATQRLTLTALFERLGTANGETPTMIPPGARSPHPYQGTCTQCHRIGTTGSLATDQGDTVVGAPPPIRANSSPPHRDRGPCTACHQILP